MNDLKSKTIRDVFIEAIFNRMHEDERIFFLSADFGSPKLDLLREKFKDRFINVGIAEQNLINVSAGLALEGFIVFAYAIAPFLTMRAYEQIRVNLSLQAQLKDLNVNLIGVGSGVSYDMSGPSHHCLEDISIMRTLPHIEVFSPSDWVLARDFLEYAIRSKKPKYLRFDGKPLPAIYRETKKSHFEDGFYELKKGKEVCLVSTGFLTHRALRAVNTLSQGKIDVGLIDIFFLKYPHKERLFSRLKKYKFVITLEEAFIEKGGLDSLISNILRENNSTLTLKSLGFKDAHIFTIGARDHLHKINGLDESAIIKHVVALLRLRK